MIPHNHAAGCIWISSRSRISEKVPLSLHTTNTTGYIKEFSPMSKMGSWDTLCDTGLHGSQRLAADLRVNKRKRAANPTTLTCWESMLTHGLTCVGNTIGRAAIFRKPRKTNFFRAFPKHWVRGSPGLSKNNDPSFTNTSILFASMLNSFSGSWFCFAMVEKLIPPFWTYRAKSSALWKGDHHKLQSLPYRALYHLTGMLFVMQT